MSKRTRLVVFGVVVSVGCASPTLDTRTMSPTTTEYEPAPTELVNPGCTNTAAGASLSVYPTDGGATTLRIRPGPVELQGVTCANGRNFIGGQD